MEFFLVRWAGAEGHCPGSIQVGLNYEMAEFVILWDLVQNIQFTDQPDLMHWRWTATGEYTSKSAYRAQLHGSYSLIDTYGRHLDSSRREQAQIFCMAVSIEQDPHGGQAGGAELALQSHLPIVHCQPGDSQT
jgi:hypothetical protein